MNKFTLLLLLIVCGTIQASKCWYYTNKYDCQSDPSCVFTQGSFFCSNRCPTLNETDCHNPNNPCTYIPAKCTAAIKCSNWDGYQTECTQKSSCYYDQATATCTNSFEATCRDKKYIFDCTQNTQCEWDNGLCMNTVESSCSRDMQEDICTSMSKFCTFIYLGTCAEKISPSLRSES